MRSGTWRPNMVTHLAVTATINGTPRDCTGLTVKSQSLGGNPFLDAGALSTTATFTLSQRKPVQRTIVTPWSDTAGTLPRRGQSVDVELSDTRGQDWPVLQGGRLDAVPGSIRSAERQIDTIDLVDDLSQQVKLRAQAATMPPVDGGGGNRRMNLTAEWVLDALGEQIGYAATPTGGNVFNMLRVSMLGSVAPTAGTATQVSQYATDATEPRATVMDGERLIVRDLNVRYSVADNMASASFVATWDTNPQVSGESCEVVFHNSGNDPQEGLLLRNGDDDVIRVYGVHGGTATQIIAIPRNNVAQAVMEVTAASDLTVKLTAGGTSTTATTTRAAGWSCSRIYVRGPGRAGALCVTTGTIHPVAPKMRIRTARPTYLYGFPYLEGSFLDLFTTITRAICGVTWLATDGTLEWTGRRWLDVQPRSAMVFDTELTWDDITWTDNTASARTAVNLAYKDPAISIRSKALAPAYTESSATSMEVGDTQEIWVQPDSTDQSWLMPDTGVILDTGGGQDDTHFEGNWIGGCFIYDQPDPSGVTERMAGGNELSAVYSWVDYLQPVCKLTFTLNSQPAKSRFEMRTTRYHKRAAQPLPQFCTRGLIDWRDATRSWSTNGTSGPAEDIDGSYWMGQHDDAFALWRDDLSSWATASWPTLLGVVVGYDPRTEVGDKVVLQDKHITGVTLDVVVSGLDSSPFEDQMTLAGWVTAAAYNGVPLPADSASWDRIVTKWKGA